MRNYIKNAHFPDNKMVYHNYSEEEAEFKLNLLINDIFIKLYQNAHLLQEKKHNAHVTSYYYKIKTDVPNLKDIKNIEVMFYIDDRLDTFSNLDKTIIIITNNENYGLQYCSFCQINRTFIELIDEEFGQTEIPYMVSANDEICLNTLKISKEILESMIIKENLTLDIADMYSNPKFNILDSLIRNANIFVSNGLSINESISLVCNIAEELGDYKKHYHTAALMLALNSTDEKNHKDNYDEESLETAMNTNYRESQIDNDIDNDTNKENKKGFGSFIKRIFNR